MEERTIHLKIKVKSLVNESKSIRKEAKKVSGMVKWNLNNHRTTVVRDHTRHNLLAYGILRGIPYEVMEEKCYEYPDFKRVFSIAKRFGATDDMILKWKEDSELYLVKDKKVA
jgi:hypothetical protein